MRGLSDWRGEWRPSAETGVQSETAGGERLGDAARARGRAARRRGLESGVWRVEREGDRVGTVGGRLGERELRDRVIID